MNTLIRVWPVSLIRVLGHTLVWVISNNLYVVYHRLAVLMLYILLFITIVACVCVPHLFLITSYIIFHFTSFYKARDCQILHRILVR